MRIQLLLKKRDLGSSEKAWMCIRDSNEVLHFSEKYGYVSRPYIQMKRFQEAVEDCELSDLGFWGLSSHGVITKKIICLQKRGWIGLLET